MINGDVGKEIKILEALKLLRGDDVSMGDVIRSTGMKIRDYYRFIQNMKRRNIYPSVDMRKSRVEIKNYMIAYPIELIIDFVVAVGDGDCIFYQDKAENLLKNRELRAYMEYIRTNYHETPKGMWELLDTWYGHMKAGDVPQTFITDVLTGIPSKKDIKVSKLREIFRLKSKKYINNIKPKETPLIEEDYIQDIPKVEPESFVVGDILGDNIKEKLKSIAMYEKAYGVKCAEIIEIIERWESEICCVDKMTLIGMESCYKDLVDRGLPALEWMRDAYDIVFRKLNTHSIASPLKCIGYYVTILRNWENFGKGGSGRWEDKLLLLKIEQMTGSRLNEEQRKKVYKLMGRHGIFALLVAVMEGKAKCPIDFYLDEILPERIGNIRKQVVSL